MNTKICKPFTMEEIHIALKALPSSRAPSINGLSAEFFVTMWEILGPDLLKVYKEALANATLCRYLNTGLLCLIPKGGCKSNLKNWRPITLLNTVYKILAKAMARKLQPMLDNLIHPNQIGFIKGRSIIDNVFLAFEMMEWVVESNQPMVMMLLDFEKAYNQVERDFLERTMAALGFDDVWIG
jgi:hypothetical protein